MDGRGEPAWNMAVDEALLRLCAVPTVRIYGWSEPAVTIGYLQKTSVVPEGRQFIRRPTGGGLVDHAADLTYTVVLPREHPVAEQGTLGSYRILHEAVAAALCECGIEARVTPCEFEGNPAACFQKAVRYDVVDAAANKLAGGAQRRTRTAMLHQGSILVAPVPDQLAGILVEHLARAMGDTVVSSELSAAEIQLAQELQTTRYSERAWNEGA